MKVIDAGKNQSWSQRFICKKCGAVLEVEESDLQFTNMAIAYAGETWDPYIYFICGACSSRVYATNDIPSGIKNKIFDLHRK